MAYRCFKLALSANNDHAEAYNNLGVLEWRRGRGEQVGVRVKGHVTASISLDRHVSMVMTQLYLFQVISLHQIPSRSCMNS